MLFCLTKRYNPGAGSSPFPGRIRLIAAGKAAWQMAQAASKTLGDSLECGVICTKYGHCGGKLPKITCCEGGHPIPDENSIRATDAALSLVQGLTAQDTVLFLLSGGGSALFEKPLIPLQELQDLYPAALLPAAQVSSKSTPFASAFLPVKGGRFAKLCQPARVFSIVLSDILGDPLDMIASGPACPDASTCVRGAFDCRTLQFAPLRRKQCHCCIRRRPRHFQTSKPMSRAAFGSYVPPRRQLAVLWGYTPVCCSRMSWLVRRATRGRYFPPLLGRMRRMGRSELS